MTHERVVIRPAQPVEADILTGLALRSKAYWGYSSEFIEACRDELTITPASIAQCPTRVADVHGTPAGFYALYHVEPARVELGDLFVEPFHIGTGVGRALLGHAIDAAREDGYSTMVIQADPNAEPFYLAMGAVTVSTRPSDSIPGRSLPLMELALTR